MASLQGVLAGIPGLGGYVAGAEESALQQNAQFQQAGMLQKIAATAREQEQIINFRNELAAARTPEEKLMIAEKYALPKEILASGDRRAALEAASATREAAQENARAMQTERLQQQAELARQRSEDMKLSLAERNQARMEMIRLAASLRPERPQQPLQAIVGPDGKPVLVPREQAIGQTPFSAGAAPEKALPSSLANKYLENVQNLRKAEMAETLLAGKKAGDVPGDPNATGKKGLLTNMGVLGDMALNAMDPAGVDTRAAIGDLGSMVIHDRSGAAVTAAEFPRLRPFIPLASDSPDVARKKVKRFVQEYKAEVEAQREFFAASGYKVPQISAPGGSRKFANEAEAAAARKAGKINPGDKITVGGVEGTWAD